MLPCIINLHNNKQFTRFRLYLYCNLHNNKQFTRFRLYPVLVNLHNNKQFTRFRLYPVLVIYITINNLPDLDFTLYY